VASVRGWAFGWVLLATAAGWACSSSSPSGETAKPAGTTAIGDDASAPDGAGSTATPTAEAGGQARDTGASSDGSSEGGSEAGPSTQATIHYLGRFDTRDPAGPRFAWPGTAITATFQGTGIQATLSDTGSNYLVAVIDGGVPSAIATSGASKTYTLASNLPSGQHTLVLTKRTEANVGVEQLLALTPQGGALVPSPDPFTRRIEYVGDSITCGYGDLGDGPNCHFSPETEDETVAYGSLGAAALDAQQTVTAYSGKGMYREYGGSTTNQMPVLFNLTLPDDPTSTWDFTTPPPDLVVINLSSNDFATGDPGNAFVQAYSTFLQTLRQRYPNAYVLCVLAATMDEPNRTIAAGYIQGVVDQARSAGDARVSTLQIPGDAGTFFGFATQLPSDGYGCDYHPSVTTQQLMGTQLAAAIPPIVGW
jgi:lysophospholipase L1-like esterase